MGNKPKIIIVGAGGIGVNCAIETLSAHKIVSERGVVFVDKVPTKNNLEELLKHEPFMITAPTIFEEPFINGTKMKKFRRGNNAKRKNKRK